MGKIYYLMGKSSSGKDSIYKELQKRQPDFRTVTLYTTRPIRDGETDGVEYHFIDAHGLSAYEKAGKIIECRTYQTIHGPWAYATIDDGQIDLTRGNYLIIGTLESYEKMKAYYGPGALIPLYIEVEDGERLYRALRREREQAEPKYAEMCRRFLADSEDFSEKRLKEAGIKKRYINDDMERCLNEIIKEIRYGKF